MKLSTATVVVGLCVSAVLLSGCAPAGGNAGPSEESATRTVETVFGQKQIPTDPQRVVIVQASALDTALSLGIEPVGSTYWGGAGGVQDYLVDEVPADMAVVGNDDEPDFEAIAALEPDLIIGDEAISDNLAMFEAIAPVAAYNSLDSDGRSDWRHHLSAIAGFTSREDEASTVISDFDAMVAELDAEIATPGQAVIPLRVRADHVRHYLPASFVSAGVLQGLTQIELPGSQVESENGDWSVIPPERVSVLSDADVIIAFTESPEAYTTLTAQSLWRALPAVQSDNVCVTENQTAWILAGPSAAEIVANDVRSCLAAA